MSGATEEAAASEAVVAEASFGQPAPPDDTEGSAEGIGGPGAPAEGTEDQSPEQKRPPRPSPRTLTTTIVFVTLLAALGGFLLNRASVASSNAADTAQELSLESSASRASAFQAAEADYAHDLALQSLEAQASQEILEAASDVDLGATWAAAYQATEQQVKRTAASLSTGVHPDLADGDPDPNFPYDFYTRESSQGTYLSAQSDAYNDVSGRWGQLVDSYTAILTIIAAALFLFGSAYVLYGRSRLLATALGTAMLCAAVAWGGSLAAVREPDKPSQAAARDYTAGVLALSEASTATQFGPAITDFTAAIAARPDFAQAYSERATAEISRGSLHIGYGFIANVEPHWLRLATTDELKAYQLGEHDANQVLDVGYSEYQLWQLQGGHGLVPSGVVTWFRRAVNLDPTDPTDLVDYALSLMARQDYGAARQAYQVALEHMLFQCAGPVAVNRCTTPQPATARNLQKSWVAGALETLGTLSSSAEAAATPMMRAQITAAQGMVAASMAEGKVVGSAPEAGLRISSLQAFLDPNFLGVDVSVPASSSSSQLTSAPLTIVWYEQARGSRRWSAIPAATCWGHITSCGQYFSQAHEFQFETLFLYTDNSCFTNVTYRVDLYLGSTLVSQRELSSSDDDVTTNLKPALDKGMNIGICVPSHWHAQPPLDLSFKVNGTSSTVTGPLTGSEFSYQSPDHSHGVFVFRLYPPQTSRESSAAGSREVVKSVVGYVVNLLGQHGLPADMSAVSSAVPNTIWAGPLSTELLTRFESASTGTTAYVGAAILGTTGASSTPTSVDGNISSEVLLDHAITVTVVYGPAAFWVGRPSIGSEVYSSWSLLSYG